MQRGLRQLARPAVDARHRVPAVRVEPLGDERGVVGDGGLRRPVDVVRPSSIFHRAHRRRARVDGRSPPRRERVVAPREPGRQRWLVSALALPQRACAPEVGDRAILVADDRGAHALDEVPPAGLVGPKRLGGAPGADSRLRRGGEEPVVELRHVELRDLDHPGEGRVGVTIVPKVVRRRIAPVLVGVSQARDPDAHARPAAQQREHRDDEHPRARSRAPRGRPARRGRHRRIFRGPGGSGTLGRRRRRRGGHARIGPGRQHLAVARARGGRRPRAWSGDPGGDPPRLPLPDHRSARRVVGQRAPRRDQARDDVGAPVGQPRAAHRRPRAARPPRDVLDVGAILRFEREQVAHQRDDLVDEARLGERLQGLAPLREVLLGPRERPPEATSGHDLEQHDAERVDVAGRRVLEVEALRGHVVERPERDGAGQRLAGREVGARRPEVEQLDLAVRRHLDVRRLDVPVDEPERPPVRAGLVARDAQRGRHLGDDLQGGADRDRPGGEDGLEVDAVDVLHDDAPPTLRAG